MPDSRVRPPWWRVALAALTLLAAPAVRPGAQAPTQPAPAPPATSAISGVVVDGATGRPLEGSVVALVRRTGAPLSSTTRMLTDDQGRFVFKDLPAGDGYSVSATRYGYLPGDYGRSESGGIPQRIKLGDNQWIGTARISLWRPGAVSGTVIDEHGEPVVGIFVRALTTIFAAGEKHVAAAATATTDDRGMYRLTGLREGKYLVAVPVMVSSVPASTTVSSVTPMFGGGVLGGSSSAGPTSRTVELLDVDAGTRIAPSKYPVPAPAADGRRLSYRQTFYPGAATIGGATVVEVGPGADLRGIDVRLEPVPASRVAGTLEGAPELVGSRTLRLLPEGAEDLGDGSETATAITRADGTFTFVNVPAGVYTIDARRAVAQLEFRGNDFSPLPRPPNPGSGSGMNSTDVPSGPTGTTLTTWTSGGDDPYFARSRVTVGNQDVTGLTVPLQRASRLSGRVAWEGAQPNLFLVMAEPANGNPSLGQIRQRIDLASSTFVLDGLQPAAYYLRFSGSATVKSITAGGRDYTHTPFDASVGRDFNDVVVTFTDKICAIAGNVRDRNANPPGSAAVILFPVEAAQWRQTGFTPPRLRSVDTMAGAFSLTPLPAGDYYVLAVDSALADGWQDPAFLERAAPLATRVTLAWGETKTVELTIAAVR